MGRRGRRPLHRSRGSTLHLHRSTTCKVSSQPDIEGTYGITMIRRFLSATISPRSPKTSTQGKKKKKKKRQSEGVSSPSSSTPKASSFRLRNNSNHSTDAGVSGSTLDEFDINIQIRRAAEKGDAKILASLLDQEGANVKAHTRPGNRTALHCAAFRGHYECVRLILSHGADPNAIDDFDRTALHRAARKGHKQVVRLLIDRGSDVLMVDSNELLPSDLAKKIKFDPTVYDLLVAAEKIARLPRVPPVLPTESSPPVRSLYYRTQLVEAQWYEEKEGIWTEEVWYPATIVKSHKSGYYEVDYDQGHRAINVPVEKIRPIIWHNLVTKLEKENDALSSRLDSMSRRAEDLEDRIRDMSERYESCKKEMNDLNSQYERVVNSSSERGESDESVDRCVICVTAPRSVVLIPCRHLCLCEECVAHVQKMRTRVCPLCREPIDSHICVFT